LLALGCSRGVRGQNELPPAAATAQPHAVPSEPLAQAAPPKPALRPAPSSAAAPIGALPGSRDRANVFLSGHSAFGLIMPAMLDQIARNEGRAHAYNLQMGIGSSMRWRLSGKGSEQDRDGKARTLDVHDELPNPKTIGSGQRYDTLVVTEAGPVISQIMHGDSVGQLRAFHALLAQSDPKGTAYFFDTWEKVDAVDGWLATTRKKQVLWQCIADAANRAPELAKSPIRMLPAGLSLARAVEAAHKGELPGIAPEDFFVPPPDRHHLSILGHFYMALTLYSSLYGRPVERAPLSFTTPQGTQSGFVSQENATRLQSIAWDAVRQFYAKPPAPRSMASCRAEVSKVGCDGADCTRKVDEVFKD
jgi:hypothetical protein